MSQAESIEYLRDLVTSHEYLTQAARGELDRLDGKSQPTELDVLRARAFIHAHIGMDDQAVAELNALASESGGNSAEILNKLSQARLRRNKDDDAAAAEAAATRALSLPNLTPGEKWLAHQNLALAHWCTGDTAKAALHAASALELVDDPRTHVLLAYLAASTADPADYESLKLPASDILAAGAKVPAAGALARWVSRFEPMK